MARGLAGSSFGDRGPASIVPEFNLNKCHLELRIGKQKSQLLQINGGLLGSPA